MCKKRFVMAIAVTLSLIAPAGAQEEIKPFNRRIVGGEKTDIKQHPWQVALDIKIEGETHLCGGSIIAQRWVLSAAHCFGKTTNAGDVRAKAGATNYVAAGIWTEIERVIIHEGYNPKTFENDIALIKLRAPPAGRVIPLVSAVTTVPISQPLEVTGWGATAEGGYASRILVKANVPNADIASCNAQGAYNGRIKAGMMCAGYKDGGVDSCQGDSGGPLVLKGPDGPVLVGIVSWGEGCARELKYGVYTRLTPYRDWITKVITSDGR